MGQRLEISPSDSLTRSRAYPTLIHPASSTLSGAAHFLLDIRTIIPLSCGTRNWTRLFGILSLAEWLKLFDQTRTWADDDGQCHFDRACSSLPADHQQPVSPLLGHAPAFLRSRSCLPIPMLNVLGFSANLIVTLHLLARLLDITQTPALLSLRERLS